MAKKHLISKEGRIDYSVATFSDIFSDLNDIYLYETRRSKNKLENLKKDVMKNHSHQSYFNSVLKLIDDFILLYQVLNCKKN